MKGKALLALVIAAFAIMAIFAAPHVYIGIEHFLYPIEHEKLICEYADMYELDVYTVLGLIKAESNFVSDAESHKGARGLMQLTEETAKWAAKKCGTDDFDVSDLNEPEMNIKLGCWYLSYLLDVYDGDLTLALCAYNAGSGNVARWLENEKYSKDGITLDEIPFEETKQYVIKTKEYSKKYKELYSDL